MPADIYLYQQVAPWASVSAWFPLVPDAYALPIVNACWNGHFDFLALCNIASTPAVWAFLLDYFACPMAVRAKEIGAVE